MYSSVIGSASKLMQHPTIEITHQFGLRTVAFFALIFAWILIAPTKVPWDTNANLRKLQLAVAVAAALAQ